MSDGAFGAGFGAVVSFAVVIVGSGMLWGCPQYSVYQSRLTGEAEFARAEANRQVIVRQAQAKFDAAKLEAGAEIERARGAAEANKILGESLKGKEEYLRYLWINKLDDAKDRTIVYIPTEAGIPILEAGKR